MVLSTFSCDYLPSVDLLQWNVPVIYFEMFNMSNVYLPTLSPTLEVLFAKVLVPDFHKGKPNCPPCSSPSGTLSVLELVHLFLFHQEEQWPWDQSAWLFMWLALLISGSQFKGLFFMKGSLACLSQSCVFLSHGSVFPSLMFSLVYNFTYLLTCHCLCLHHSVEAPWGQGPVFFLTWSPGPWAKCQLCNKSSDLVS